MGRGLWGIDGRHLQIGHAPGQALAGLAHQIQRGRAQQQEMPKTLARRAALVDQAAQHGKDFRGAVDFVNDHQLGRLHAQIGFGIVQAPAIGG